MSGKITVKSVNLSREKGTIKVPVERIVLNAHGVEGDAHAGAWHRQVSMLARESIEKFENEAGRKIGFGEFAENITTEGMLLYEANPLDRFVSEQVALEVTQIGKKCHGDACAIFREVGNCVMPKEGIFCRVIKNGGLQAGDPMEYIPRTFHNTVVTLSDRASKGEYEDRSGPGVVEHLEQYYHTLGWKHEIDHHIIPDQAEQLDLLLKDARVKKTDVFITTGGTGIGPRDITPEVVQHNLDMIIPGIMDAIRLKYGQEKPNALLSRSLAGVMGQTLVFALPGSVKAIREYMPEILKSLRHMIMMLHHIDAH
ncbi:MAG: molybdopterin-binding protein [Bacteroidales bacterium]